MLAETLLAHPIEKATTWTSSAAVHRRQYQRRRNISPARSRLNGSSPGMIRRGSRAHWSASMRAPAVLGTHPRPTLIVVSGTGWTQCEGEPIAEILVGEAVEPFRNQVVVATKFDFRNGTPSKGADSRPEGIRQVAERGSEAAWHRPPPCSASTASIPTCRWRRLLEPSATSSPRARSSGNGGRVSRRESPPGRRGRVCRAAARRGG